ncbi:hypothetical protein VTN77DRAFT_9526 [Rasamsonia byssochlamydoides]|uniref:uncharacterized protein n=1 Tax=Rasamsonia byssochlamydoides TaxID=89139 RepID=UPI0037420773
MRSSILLGALGAIGAIAGPIDKRVYTTEIIVITVTETVTPGEPATATATSAATINAAEFYRHSSVSYTTVLTTSTPEPTSSSSSSVVVVTPSETPAPAPVSTTAPSVSVSSVTSVSSVASVASPSPSQVSTVSSAAPSPSAANSYQATILYNHNIHRANHSAAALTWSSDLEASALQLANGCVYEHNTDINGGGYGQNIGYGIPADNIGAMITNLMYNDEFGYFEGLYGQANPDMSNFDHWGHFSQIVWKGTTQVGCATVVCNSLGNVDSSEPLPFTVCNYSPPGNYAGEYAENVGEPLGQPYYSVPE